jgi:hypothetical protein
VAVFDAVVIGYSLAATVADLGHHLVRWPTVSSLSSAAVLSRNSQY